MEKYEIAILTPDRLVVGALEELVVLADKVALADLVEQRGQTI